MTFGKAPMVLEMYRSVVVIKSVFLSSFSNCSSSSTLILMLESQINLLLCILHYYENERDHLWLRPPLPLSFATPALATAAAGYITVLICFPIIIQSTYVVRTYYICVPQGIRFLYKLIFSYKSCFCIL